jgi:hypothetical protein
MAWVRIDDVISERTLFYRHEGNDLKLSWAVDTSSNFVLNFANQDNSTDIGTATSTTVSMTAEKWTMAGVSVAVNGGVDTDVRFFISDKDNSTEQTLSVPGKYFKEHKDNAQTALVGIAVSSGGANEKGWKGFIAFFCFRNTPTTTDSPYAAVTCDACTS